MTFLSSLTDSYSREATKGQLTDLLNIPAQYLAQYVVNSCLLGYTIHKPPRCESEGKRYNLWTALKSQIFISTPGSCHSYTSNEASAVSTPSFQSPVPSFLPRPHSVSTRLLPPTQLPATSLVLLIASCGPCHAPSGPCCVPNAAELGVQHDTP